MRTVTDLPVIEKTVGPQWNNDTKTGNWDPSRAPQIDKIYIHTMVGTADDANARFNDANSGVSAHYGIRLNGEIWHWVDEDKTAYHSGVYGENQRSIGIEHEDNGNAQDSTRTPEQYSQSAKLVANLCNTYKIPCDRQHILKHSEAIQPNGTPYPTQCPDGLDIDKIVAEANAILNPTQAAQANTYKGLDLTNLDSVKAAIDTWKEVADGVFVRKTDIDATIGGLQTTNQQNEDKIRELTVQLADAQSKATPPNYTPITTALGIDANSTVDQIVGNITTLKQNFQQQVLQMQQGKTAVGPIINDDTVKIGVEGQGPAITAPAATLQTLPQSEKAALIQKHHNFIAELEKFLGLTVS